MPFSGDIEDRLAIRELIEAYADAVTQNDARVWGALWAADAEWSLPDIPAIGTIRGRDAIVAMWSEAMKQFPGLMFMAWPGSIEVDGATAAVRSYTSEVYDRGGVTMRDRGVYEDLCVRIDGRWLFRQRSFRKIHSQG